MCPSPKTTTCSVFRLKSENSLALLFDHFRKKSPSITPGLDAFLNSSETGRLARHRDAVTSIPLASSVAMFKFLPVQRPSMRRCVELNPYSVTNAEIHKNAGQNG
jgi:hypothetical protein